MFRNYQSVRKLKIAAAALALCASGAAFADDSSMSMWTGDSYAFFNNLDYNPGLQHRARTAVDRRFDADVAQRRSSKNRSACDDGQSPVAAASPVGALAAVASHAPAGDDTNQSVSRRYRPVM